ncbi:uncharacterized protein LOC132607805 [Lycium barbarum]|uniref:uncharacterized protein LOC132607805 n=1 Tax=Lycium barbarum TaxID=112863 RepID=UPI00293F14C2|nr:uncharacterized protein LOC132607805 [Lycium barbarum]
MTIAPVLALAVFSKTFIIETDACSTGMGAVLMQEDRPLAFFSKALAPKHLGLSTYEKEYMDVLSAVDRWRHYLQGDHFIIRTDHHSLKYLLGQRVTTALQQKGLTKLLGLDYEVQYKKGTENRVADALSRKKEDEAYFNAITTAEPTWMLEVSRSYAMDPTALQPVAKLITDPTSNLVYSLHQSIIRYKGKIYVGRATDLRFRIFNAFHSSPLGGTQDNRALIGELDIAMYFIEGLPSSGHKNFILVVVDRLTKYGHFLTLKHPYTTKEVADLFLHEIYKLHGLPKSIVSDRDSICNSQFWQQLFKSIGTKLNMSSAYHPQSDGQTERLNTCLESYL